MPFEIKYDTDTACIMCRVTGEISPKVANEVLTALIEALQEHDCIRMITDLREAKLNLSIIDLYQVPKMFTQAGVNPLTRRALVVSANIENFSFFETASVNRAQLVKIFTDFDEALEWLTA